MAFLLEHRWNLHHMDLWQWGWFGACPLGEIELSYSIKHIVKLSKVPTHVHGEYWDCNSISKFGSKDLNVKCIIEILLCAGSTEIIVSPCSYCNLAGIHHFPPRGLGWGLSFIIFANFNCKIWKQKLVAHYNILESLKSSIYLIPTIRSSPTQKTPCVTEIIVNLLLWYAIFHSYKIWLSFLVYGGLGGGLICKQHRSYSQCWWHSIAIVEI